MKIRPFIPEDAGAIADIIRRDLVEVNSADYPAKIITAMVDEYTPQAVSALAKRREMFVAENEATIVGTVSLHEDTVFTLFVDPAMHGHGIGSALMDYVENLAKVRAKSHVVVPASLTALNFYLHRGYKEVRRSFDDGHVIGVIMQKELT